MDQSLKCSICGGVATPFATVDFNKSCLEASGASLPPAGIGIDYARCDGCGFCFAPALMAWDLDTFKERIYNDEYVLVDPEYIDTRPRANAASLLSLFGHATKAFQHLDYGGGNGLLSSILVESGWQSRSYDPFVDGTGSLERLGKHGLITAFEVFEHVPDVPALLANLRALQSGNGIILFSTIVTDEHIQPGQPLNWWYASPRNGHISLFSKKSLAILAVKHGLKFRSLSEGVHVFYKNIPTWANGLFGIG